jgi:hypothetical protein
MAKLTTAARKDLPARDFAGPNRSFPVENKAHARDALSGASRAEHVGNITRSEERAIDHRADSVLGKATSHLREMHGRR